MVAAVHWHIDFLVALPSAQDLLLRAKHLFFAAMLLATNGRQELRRLSNLLYGGAAWRHARDNPTRAPSAPRPQWAQKTHWQGTEDKATKKRESRLLRRCDPSSENETQGKEVIPRGALLIATRQTQKGIDREIRFIRHLFGGLQETPYCVPQGTDRINAERQRAH